MLFILVSLILLLDQFTKFLITRSLSINQSIPLLKNIFHLTYIHNSGAAFGIFKNQILIFILASLSAISLIIFNLRDKSANNSLIYRISLGLVLAGALGNLMDRLFLGAVIDFLDFRIWPVFNIADSAITVGAILLGYSILFEGKSKNKVKV